MHSISLRTPFLTLLPFALSALVSAQTVHFTTGFETPGYANGPLAGDTIWNGQDGWVATGDLSSNPDLSKIRVQSAVTKSGGQAVEIDATGQPCPYAHIRRHVLINVMPAEPMLDIAFDLRISQAVTTRSEWGIQAQVGPGPAGLLEWWIDVAGELHITGANGFLDTGVVLQRDTWYRVITRMDYAAQTCSVLVDGQVAGTVPALPIAQLWAHAFTSLMFIQPGDDRMYIDNYSFTTHDGSLVTNYCTAGTSSHGCAATLSSTGTPSAGASSGFVISASNVEGLASGTFFYGINGRVALPWAAGSTSFMCVKSPVQRVGTSNSGGTSGACDGSYSLDFQAFAASHPSALGQPLTVGQRFDVQAWYRDPPAPKATQLSNALEFTLLP